MTRRPRGCLRDHQLPFSGVDTYVFTWVFSLCENKCILTVRAHAFQVSLLFFNKKLETLLKSEKS